MEKISGKKWYVYMLRCEDGSIYTGITTDVEKRFRQHKDGKGAKYTRFRKPLKIEMVFALSSKIEASKLEYYIKKLKKPQKEFLTSEEYCKNFFIKDIEKDLEIKINL